MVKRFYKRAPENAGANSGAVVRWAAGVENAADDAWHQMPSMLAMAKG